MAKEREKRGLGRGLSALMADVDLNPAETTASPRRPEQYVPVEKIEPNPDQPRRDFEPAALEELAASIREKGVIQPLIVRKHPTKPDHYEIVAGERRWRASQMAKLHQLPVIIREFNDTEVLEVAIIENIQRADLNALEEALAYKQLMSRFGHTQEKLAEALSKSRSHIANLMRLLQLPEEVQGYLREGKLSAGHARAMITAEDPVGLARQAVAKTLSVRDVEKLAKKQQGGEERKARPKPQKDADTRALEGDLSATIGMKVAIDHTSNGSGKITISYGDLEELDRLCQMLSNG
ncbi:MULTISPECIES: ParB/RepB/Spo0J family partition protein [Thioclava]|uniref:Chromosome partitioning protein ParB n=1 Tax=Thioclava nitratireducens TaxID=1915078 RepID=A0ABM6IDC4_9RHOB|nr:MULTISPECIES: ParB/RepB/Spo0J family partition protein [Thioclava]AQS46710.1 chromosome partitioning protein ParB [Thioclava nitratireducens]OWY02142.1 chromosome partitioning protein ParB [Thioclava sp. IC9]OWY02758.1 chromosome partitioning protein ParB [Thioclava sp. F1Mire-8]OWY07653.1 chromosome partitioning protein ParB [Thioclava sp. F42-5]OWY16613.1 chromosome partitioning protein ParB [Thioclava sp. JM3]